MIIDKTSWHYRVWYFSATLFDSFAAVQETNLCSYMRQIVFWLPLKLLGCGIIVLCLAPLYLVIKSFFTVLYFIFGQRPDGWGLDDAAPYKGLPIFGYEIYPWHVLLLAALFGLPYLGFGYLGLMTVGSIFATVSLMTAVILFLVKSPSMAIFREWASAKKQGVCPLIEFK